MAEKKRKGLKKGMEALIPRAAKPAVPAQAAPEGASVAIAAGAVKVKLTQIEPNRSQPRKVFDEEALQELASSIKQYGLLQPILVQDKKDHYEIIAGERRWRASRLAGLKEVPVIIRDDSPQEIVELSLIENIQREDLNPMEEAQAYRRLLEEFELTQEQVAERVGKNRATVANALRLLRLSPEVQNMVIDGRLSAGHARALVAVEDQNEQARLAVQIVTEGLSVRETEALIKKWSKKPAKPKAAPTIDEALTLIYRNIEEQLRQAIGTKVTIRPSGKKGGKIEVSYYNQDDLERITDLLATRKGEEA